MKQVIVMRTDLNMRKGKMIAQGAHASLGILLQSNVSIDQTSVEVVLDQGIFAWLNTGMKKITLGITSEQGLLDLYEQAIRAGLRVSSVRDAGLTELEPGTITCIAIGPNVADEIDKLTGELKLL